MVIDDVAHYKKLGEMVDMKALFDYQEIFEELQMEFKNSQLMQSKHIRIFIRKRIRNITRICSIYKQL